MKQEEIPKTQKTEYKYIGTEKISTLTKLKIPKQFQPTNRLPTILGIIIVAILILAIAQFPITKLTAADPTTLIGIGFPLKITELEFPSLSNSPIQIGNLILNIIIWIILAYSIDISINLFTNIELSPTKSKEKEKTKLQSYKTPKTTVADKMTQKVFKESENSQNITPQ